MNHSKQTRATLWLAGGATSLIAASQADAAVVLQTLNQDFRSTLDGLVIFQGSASLVQDAGQWKSAPGNVFFYTVGGPPTNDTNALSAFGAGSFVLGHGAGVTSGSSTTANALPAGRAAQGYIQWNLSDSTQGWLRVRGDRPAGAGAGTLTATGFVYDDANFAVRPNIADVQVAGGNIGLIPLPVPEPSSLSLLALGVAGILKRRNRKAA